MLRNLGVFPHPIPFYPSCSLSLPLLVFYLVVLHFTPVQLVGVVLPASSLAPGPGGLG